MNLPGRALLAPLALAWVALTLAPALAGLPVLLGRVVIHQQADLFFAAQDAWVVATMTVFLIGVVFAGPLRLGGVLDRARRRAGHSAMILAGVVFVTSLAGVYLVFGDFALSRDEDMANFGAEILRHGQLWAPLAPGWSSFTAALEPEFVRFSFAGLFWQPAYLPVNAALRALAGPAAAWVNPVLAAASVLLTAAVARRLWPDRADLAVVSAVFVALSSQVLVAAMTPYAMTAHMAFNLAWLWMHLRGGRAGHAGALVVGFLATGLHQLVFHPLFVAPFVAQLWLNRRWSLAGLYTVGYAAICIFWLELSPLALAWQGGALGHAAAGVSGLGAQVSALIDASRPPTLRTMAENLMRFASWQGLLAAPLAVIGVAGAVRHAGPLRCMVAGLFLTTAMLVVLMPYQGYGWGYRYWHGLIGPLALIAALGWRRLSDGVDRAWAQSVFVAAAAVSAFVLVPIRLVQAHDQVAPYARAWRTVASASTPLVIIDPKGGWYLDDLVRNDPYLANRPLVLRAEGLTRGQLGLLCDRYAVSTLDAAGAKTFGIRAGAAQGSGQSASRWRRLGLPPACGPGGTPAVRLAAPDSSLRGPGGSRPPR